MADSANLDQRVNGVGRDAEEPRCLIVYFNRPPTNDDMRRLHDAACAEFTEDGGGVRPVEAPTLLTREEVHAALPAPTTSGEFHGGLNVQMTWHHLNEWAENIQRAVLAKHGVGPLRNSETGEGGNSDGR